MPRPGPFKCILALKTGRRNEGCLEKHSKFTASRTTLPWGLLHQQYPSSILKELQGLLEAHTRHVVSYFLCREPFEKAEFDIQKEANCVSFTVSKQNMNDLKYPQRTPIGKPGSLGYCLLCFQKILPMINWVPSF